MQRTPPKYVADLMRLLRPVSTTTFDVPAVRAPSVETGPLCEVATLLVAIWYDEHDVCIAHELDMRLDRECAPLLSISGAAWTTMERVACWPTMPHRLTLYIDLEGRAPLYRFVEYVQRDTAASALTFAIQEIAMYRERDQIPLQAIFLSWPTYGVVVDVVAATHVVGDVVAALLSLLMDVRPPPTTVAGGDYGMHLPDAVDGTWKWRCDVATRAHSEWVADPNVDRLVRVSAYDCRVNLTRACVSLAGTSLRLLAAQRGGRARPHPLTYHVAMYMYDWLSTYNND
jgi:hypothetical protein